MTNLTQNADSPCFDFIGTGHAILITLVLKWRHLRGQGVRLDTNYLQSQQVRRKYTIRKCPRIFTYLW